MTREGFQCVTIDEHNLRELEADFFEIENYG